MIAIDFVTKAAANQFDVGVIASCDTDLAPAVEAVLDRPGPGRRPEVELIVWAGRASRIGIPRRTIVYHEIGPAAYLNMQDLTDCNMYGESSRKSSRS